MRVAALYDIHGNLPALEAVLEQISRDQIDELVVGGDIVPGPFPRETLERLVESKIPTRFIRGNCEVALLQQIADEPITMVPQQVWPVIEWTARQFGEEHRKFIETWPRTIQLSIPSDSPNSSPQQTQVLFCHGTARDENEIFTRLTADDRVKAIFAGIEAEIVVCGHTHMQFDRTVDNVRIVNAGSVGLPFGKRGAYWLLIDSGIQLRRTEYDYEGAAARVRASAYPQAEQFAANYILNPASEEQMLEIFERSVVGSR